MSPPSTDRRPRVLLLSREPSVVRMLTDILVEEELEVESVATLQDALARLRAVRFSTLVVDERSTGLGEARLRTRLRALGLPVPVMMLPPSLDLTRLLFHLHLSPVFSGSLEAPSDLAVARESGGSQARADLQRFCLSLGLASGLAATLPFLAGADWRFGWIPIALAVGALRPLYRYLDDREEPGPLGWLEFHLILFSSGLLTWMGGMSLV